MDEDLHLAKKGRISMDNIANQQKNDAVVELSDQELNNITGGGVTDIIGNSFSGAKGMYQAGKDLGIPKVLNVPVSGTLGPVIGAVRAIRGEFPGSEAIRQQVVRETQKNLAK
jgi:lactobin A/cerein 7B family class IIb bacteriocin